MGGDDGPDLVGADATDFGDAVDLQCGVRGEMSGSNPLPLAVTASAGTSGLAVEAPWIGTSWPME